jgi:hypothetical protein
MDSRSTPASTGTADTLEPRRIEVTVGRSPWDLPGTLTLPAAEQPVPAVVIVHGSGPHDRDGTIGPNTPYRDLAEGLTASGIGVLRYDKRTLVYRDRLAGAMAAFTVDDEVVDDAVAAVTLLESTPGVDPNAIFVLGHSLGGYLGPRIISRSPTARGLVILAGNSRSLPEVILDQTGFLNSLGPQAPEATAAIAQLRRQAAIAMSSALTPETPASELPFGAPASYWLDLQQYDPVATAAGLDRPVLVIGVGRDYQVTSADFEGWRRGLGGRSDVELRWFPGLNHLLIAGTDPASPQDYAVAGHVADAVVDAIAAWVGRARS